MPKQIGFDLYAMIVHYKDGTTCNCYARKTDGWYYFSDKMDFRIQLASDNRTITLQQWRRTHYSSSWYESGLLDYVELMIFGETYLQSELNPMRDDISTNHTDIVNNYNEYYDNKVITDQTIINNYNEFITNRNEMWNSINGATSQAGYNESLRRLLSLYGTGLQLLAINTSLAVGTLAVNFNKLLSELKNFMDLNVQVNETKEMTVNSKHFEDDEQSFFIMDSSGKITETTIHMPAIEESDGVTITAVQSHPTFTEYQNEINNLQDQINSLSGRISALGG